VILTSNSSFYFEVLTAPRCDQGSIALMGPCSSNFS
jgi:hypothetical protein